MVLNPLKIQEKDSKKNYLSSYPGSKSPFLGQKNFKISLAAISTRYYHPKKNFKTWVVPGTKYGGLRINGLYFYLLIVLKFNF
jgi:hypothetical protein